MNDDIRSPKLKIHLFVICDCIYNTLDIHISKLEIASGSNLSFTPFCKA
jgi:hypothetical protein